jgi:hypothetical protein
MPIEFDGVNSKVSADKLQGQTGTTITIESGHSLSGSGAGLTSLPAANLTGTLPAISGASLTGLPASGDKRNFIIDGDFTQWPEGTSFAAPSSNTYTATFFRTVYTGSGVLTVNRSTDVPTVAQSGYASNYSFETDVTTADGTIAGADQYYHNHQMTGSTAAHFAQQEVTLSFWHKHTKTGTQCVGFSNGAQDRSYVAEYTQTTTNTWEKATITLTMDTSGTWLTTDTDKGLEIKFAMAYSTAGTWTQSAGSWQAGHAYTTSNQVNNFDSTSNYFRIAQIQLVLGSTAPNFTSLPISTVKDQVNYYISRYEATTALDHIGMARAHDATRAFVCVKFPRPMRVAPTISYSATGDIGINNATTLTYATALSSNEISNWGYRFMVTVGSSVFTVDEAYVGMLKAVGDFVQFDARH